MAEEVDKAMANNWRVFLHEEFEKEFGKFKKDLQDELIAQLNLLKKYGPTLGRPTVDTLKGSQFANMKELRFKLQGAQLRFAFAFDPDRAAIILVGGNKRGKNQKKFYNDLIKIADARFQEHLSKVLFKKS